MKVLLIDNDTSIRDGLRILLVKYCPQIKEIEEADGVESGVLAIENLKPQLVFLDVERGDGTGFDLIQKLGNYDFQLVFITAYNKYAVDAFRYSAIDFLLKPIDPLELVVSVNKATAQLNNKELEQQVKILKESLIQKNKPQDQERKIALNDGNVIHYIRLSEIIYCKADGAYTQFILSNSKKIMVSKLLKEYEELFSAYNFLRTHHSFLINANRIVKFEKADGGILLLDEQQSVLVSARKKELVLEVLGRL